MKKRSPAFYAGLLQIITSTNQKGENKNYFTAAKAAKRNYKNDLNNHYIKYQTFNHQTRVRYHKIRAFSGETERQERNKPLRPNLKIDVIVLKSLPTLVVGDSITFNEDDKRPGTERTFTEKGIFHKSGTLHVKVDFFKKIEQGDTILILLHEI